MAYHGSLTGYYSDELFCLGVDPFGQLAFQVGRLVLMDGAAFCQFIDHGCYFRELLSCSGLIACFQVADRVTGGFTVITVALVAFCTLTNIFFGSCVICH